MAARDFAEVPGPAPQRGGGVNWRVIVVVAGGLAVVAGGFVAGYSLGERRGRMLAEHAGKQRLLDEIARQKKELARLKKSTKAAAANRPGATPAGELGELTFYNDLPRQPVAPAPLPEAEQPPVGRVSAPDAGHADVGHIIRQAMRQPAARPADQGAPARGAVGRWRVQVGSYQRREDAEALASRARGKGFPATVEQAMVPGLGLWFRVYVGPYAGRDAALAAQARVRKTMRISGLLLRVRE